MSKQQFRELSQMIWERHYCVTIWAWETDMNDVVLWQVAAALHLQSVCCSPGWCQG